MAMYHFRYCQMEGNAIDVALPTRNSRKQKLPFAVGKRTSFSEKKKKQQLSSSMKHAAPNEC